MSDKLDACHCCDVPVAEPISNRPGLPTVSYRVGTWATFYDAMQVAIAKDPDLAALTTRAPDDPAIALIDACAVVSDILAFYQERLANEGYLRTAVDRQSVQLLARAIGYELGAGVAASTALAFTVDQPLVQGHGIQGPTTITVPATTKAQSVPGANQLPQTFETIEDIQARAAWNAMVPKSTQRQRLSILKDIAVARVGYAGSLALADALYFTGTGTNLRPGDAIVISVDSTANAAHNDSASLVAGATCMWVSRVIPDYQAKRTRVELSQNSSPTQPAFGLAPQPQGSVELVQYAMTPANVRKKIIDQDWSEEDLSAFLEIQDWDPDWVVEHVAMLLAKEPPPADIQAFRTRTGVFGHAAPRWSVIDQSMTDNPWGDWDESDQTVWVNSQKTPWVNAHRAHLFLDRVVPGVAKRGYVALAGTSTSHPPVPFEITYVDECSLADFAISGKCTGVLLAGIDVNNLPAQFKMRRTTVYCQSEPLEIAEAPYDDPILASPNAFSITLDHMVLGLYEGQQISFTGQTLDPDTGNPSGSNATEILTVTTATHGRGYTTIMFASGIVHSYVRSTCVMNGNVANATHGTTVANELIGSGDGSQTHQTFALRNTPLTYISADTPTGSQSTLLVRVAGVQWTEVRTFYGAGPTDRIFISRQQADGSTVITFGDGIRGARLPTGRNNVFATYRTGTGPDGQIKAGKISVLAAKPLGVRSAVNPIAATGAAAPEQLADARVNAPRTVRTLDRLVSLDDFTDFARSFAGVGKALATPVWSGEQLRVHLTLGDAVGKALDPSSPVGQHLVAAIADASDNRHEVLVAGYQPRFFRLTLKLVIDAAYVQTKVIADVKTTLRTAFAYASRDLGQSVTEAEIIAMCQRRPGVIATEVSELYDIDLPVPAMTGVLKANGAHFIGTAVAPADLLLIHPVGLTITGSTSP